MEWLFQSLRPCNLFHLCSVWGRSTDSSNHLSTLSKDLFKHEGGSFGVGGGCLIKEMVGLDMRMDGSR